MYQVWTKGDEYSGWARKDCPDLKAALAEVLSTIKAGKEPFLTAEVVYEVGIKIKEGKTSETAQDKAELDKDTGAKSHGKVRRGDKETTPRLDKANGHPGASSGAGD